jgi:hypothetical protein
MAEAIGAENLYKLKKNELVSFIVNDFIGSGKLESLFLIMPENDFNLFNDMLDVDYREADESVFEKILMIGAHIFVVFAWFNAYYCLIPKEIKEAYRTFANEEFFVKRKDLQELSKYARAAVNLYGIIKTKDFTRIFNHYTGFRKGAAKIEKILEQAGLSGEQYAVFNGYLINGSLFDTKQTIDFVEYLSGLKGKKPYYIPPKEEFLRYEKINYYEETEEVSAFKEALKKGGFKDSDEREEVFLEIYWSMKNGLGQPLDYIKILNEYGFTVKSKKILQQIVSSAAHMNNNMRMWINNGHTPNEI